jgi:hypothetical protein
VGDQPSATDVPVEVEGTPSLFPSSWRELAPLNVDIGPVNGATGKKPVKVRFLESSLEAKFLRLRVTLP